MTNSELRKHDQAPVHFETPEATGIGTLNYRVSDDGFEIIYFKPHSGGGATNVIPLTDEMIALIDHEAGNLRLSMK